ncbi:hypothetical protein WCE39_08160 [Luteimonas sp. MJ174]|uniref:hypothetical protein n=1 Tax=Luteimonas sp. MJ174 TaxID=3129237 RepID=UPI0031BA8229
MPFIDHRKNTKTLWGREVAGESNPNREDIQLGCLLRIADATEAMAKRHTELMAARDYYERLARDRADTIETLRRQRAALRGTITRMKRAQEKGHA